MPDWLLGAIAAGLASFGGSYVAMRVQLAVLSIRIEHLEQAARDVRRDVTAAHRRLDLHSVPSAHMEN